MQLLQGDRGAFPTFTITFTPRVVAFGALSILAQLSGYYRLSYLLGFYALVKGIRKTPPIQESIRRVASPIIVYPSARIPATVRSPEEMALEVHRNPFLYIGKSVYLDAVQSPRGSISTYRVSVQPFP